MEFVFGIVGKDFTLMLTDGNAARSIICYQQEHDKIVALNKYAFWMVKMYSIRKSLIFTFHRI